MKEQKGLLIAIIAIVAVGVAIQVYSLVKNRKKNNEVASASKGYEITLGDLEQEVLED